MMRIVLLGNLHRIRIAWILSVRLGYKVHKISKLEENTQFEPRTPYACILEVLDTIECQPACNEERPQRLKNL